MDWIYKVKTPCYVIDGDKLKSNLKILKGVEDRTGCKILLAQKAFSCFKLYPLIGKYISGTSASGLYEARLGYEYMGKENHVFSAAYVEDEFNELVKYSDHIIFNSFGQLKKYRDMALNSGAEIGLRVNPECSTQKGSGIYDPCAPKSRLGVTVKAFEDKDIRGVSGLHFHTLCEQDADALEVTLKAFEEKFGEYLYDMEWVNFGGGHHITREGYDIGLLERCITGIQNKYNVKVYLEPGEAVALNAGYLVSSVLDITENGIKTAVIDASAACHMPDVLEMPYRPEIIGAGKAEERAYSYQLGGRTCLAGDIIGEYSFDKALEEGGRLVFCDMAIYTICKNNTFNGMPLPSIYYKEEGKEPELIKEFGYADFKERLS